ncbi:hypothetical protein HK096_007310 [Nowakowskiella sp. JEL0078]|nr:hypothetical protein HK096_007310 [Nowakowskiella sp. JEL0078]
MFQCCCPNALPGWLGGQNFSHPAFDYDEIDDLEFENLLAGGTAPGYSDGTSQLSSTFRDSGNYGANIFRSTPIGRGNNSSMLNRSRPQHFDQSNTWLEQLASLFRYKRSVPSGLNVRNRGGIVYAGTNINGDFEDLFDDQEDAELFSQEQIRKITNMAGKQGADIRRQEELDYQESQRVLTEGIQPEGNLVDIADESSTSIEADHTDFGDLDLQSKFCQTCATKKITMSDEDVDVDINVSSPTIIISFLSFSVVGLLIFLIFCAVRPHFKDIYSPRRVLKEGTPPRLPTGFFNWIPVVWNIPESFLVSTVGLDAVMFLRFLKTGIQLFGTLTVFGIGVIAPINYFSNVPKQPIFENFPKQFNETEFITAISVVNVPFGSKYLTVHLVFTWVFSFTAYLFVIKYYRGLVQLKLKFVEHVLRKTKLQRIEQRTIMVYGIPLDLRNEIELASYFESLGIGRVEQAVICRRWSHIRRAVSLRAYYLSQVELSYAKVVFNHQNKISANRGQSLLMLQIFSYIKGKIGGNADAPSMPTSAEQIEGESAFTSLEIAEDDKAIKELKNKLRNFDRKYRPRHRVGIPGFGGKIVDSTEYYIQQFQVWDNKVRNFRESFDLSAATQVGFVTFERPESAILASQILLNSQPFVCTARMAPEPRDLYWDNLASHSANPYLKLVRSTFILTVLAILIIFSVTIISAVVTPLGNLKNFSETVPWTKPVIDAMSPVVRSVLESVVSPIVLTTWTSSLPSVLLMMTQLQGLEAESWIEMGVLSKYFFYQFFNYFLLPVTAGTVLNLMAKIPILIETPGKIIEILGKGVVARAPQLVNYVMILGLASNPATLLLVAPLVLTWVFRLSPFVKSSPRAASDAYYPSLIGSMNYGVSYPPLIIVFVIGITYAPIAPIALPFCFLYFLIAYGVFKYYFLYVHLPKYESGGMQAPMVVRRCLWGMWVMQLAVGGCLAIQSSLDYQHKSDLKLSAVEMMFATFKWTSYAKTILCVLPLTVINFGLLWWLKNGYDKLVMNTPLDIISTVAEEVKGDLDGNNNSGSMAGRVVVAAAAAFKGRTYSLGSSSFTNLDQTLKKKILTPKGSIRNMNSSSTSETITSSTSQKFKSISRDIEVQNTEVETTPGNVSESNDMLSATVGVAVNIADAAINVVAPNQAVFSGEGTVEGLNGTKVAIDNELFEVPAPSTPVAVDADTSSTFSIGSATSISNPTAVFVKMRHLEPTMTRVPGILDAPIESATPVVSEKDSQPLYEAFHDKHSLRNRNSLQLSMPDQFETEKTDLILLSYLHPALIGRLPTFWLATEGSETQPQALVETREEQALQQRDMWKQVVLRQRVAINELEEERQHRIENTNRIRRERKEKRAKKAAQQAVDDSDSNDDVSFNVRSFESDEEEDQLAAYDNGTDEGSRLLPSGSDTLKKRTVKNDRRNRLSIVQSVQSISDNVFSWAHLQESGKTKAKAF